jgi:hypothetical protein
MAAARLSVSQIETLGGAPKRVLLRVAFDARQVAVSVVFFDERLEVASFDDEGWAFVDACHENGYPFAARQLLGIAREAARGRPSDVPVAFTPFDAAPSGDVG